MEMKFRTTSGVIIKADPQAEAPTPVGLADPAAERGVGQVEPAHLLRPQPIGIEMSENDQAALDYDEVSEALAEATDVVLTASQVQVLLSGHPRLMSQLLEWGVEDTELLGELADLLSTALIGETWPTYGDVERNVDEFVNRVHEAAKVKGYATR